MDPTDARSRYLAWITRTSYADSTKAAYVARVDGFLHWLAAQPGDQYAGAFTDPYVRDYAVRDYRRMLVVDRHNAIATVELHLAAIGSLFKFLGLGQPDVPRQRPQYDEPKALDEESLRRVLRAAQRRGVRDYALTMTLFSCAVRVSEAVGVNVDDVFISDRKGELNVRWGKGGKQRRVQIPPQARDALRPLIAQHHQAGGDLVGTPLFMSRQATRLSSRRAQSLIADIGEDAGVTISPHVLRHTYGRRFVEQGGDITALQRVLGHADVRTTSTYARPSTKFLEDMAERVEIDL